MCLLSLRTTPPSSFKSSRATKIRPLSKKNSLPKWSSPSKNRNLLKRIRSKVQEATVSIRLTIRTYSNVWTGLSINRPMLICRPLISSTTGYWLRRCYRRLSLETLESRRQNRQAMRNVIVLKVLNLVKKIASTYLTK